MPSSHRRSGSGQATVDYVAVICIVAVVLAGAGAAVTGTGLAGPLIRQLKLALCVVGGDICSTAHAVAAGLETCVLADERYTTRWSAGALGFKSAQQHGYSVERRSDGRITLTAAHDREAGVGLHAGFQLGPVGASAGGGPVGGWRSGMVWELQGREQLRRFLARAPRPHRLEHDADWRRAGLPAPTVRYLAGSAGAELTASLEAGVTLPLLDAGARAALGRRVGPAGTTWYFEVPSAAARALGGGLPEVELGRMGPWSVELEGGGDHRVERMVLRSSSPGARGEEVRLTRYVDLAEPAAALAARDLLSPTRAFAAARSLSAMGVLQRDVYRVRELDSGVDAELGIGVAGLGHADGRAERRLVASSVVAADGRVAQRRDCLPGARGAVGDPR